MNLPRRTFARVCALTATGRALTGALPGLAQMQGEHINTTIVHPVPSIQDTETTAQKNARMQCFREARFGMFIHWGLYSILAGCWDGKDVPGIGEWIMNLASIPVAQCKALAGRFNPTRIIGSAAVIRGTPRRRNNTFRFVGIRDATGNPA